MLADLLRAFSSAKIYDLAHTYRIGMPHHPVHPPYLFGLVKAHGEYMRGDVSSAAEAIALLEGLVRKEKGPLVTERAFFLYQKSTCALILTYRAG